MQRSGARRRRGALAVEGALVYGALFCLLYGLIAGGIGVFRYQQVACLAREAARYAAVHGADWQAETGRACARKDVLTDAVLPLTAGMAPDALALDLQWVNGTGATASDWDGVAHPPTATTASGSPVANRVRATVRYQWAPRWLLAGPLTLSSTSELPMSY